MTYFCLQVNSSGQYLNIFNGSMANGAEACQGTNNTTPNFLWEIIPGTGDYFLLKVASSGQYLNILNGSTANGAEACQGTNNTTDNFLWQFVLPGSPSPTTVVPGLGIHFYLKVKSSGQYLNILNGSTANGAVACQGTNNSTPNFLWQLATAPLPAFGSGGPAAGEWGERESPTTPLCSSAIPEPALRRLPRNSSSGSFRITACLIRHLRQGRRFLQVRCRPRGPIGHGELCRRERSCLK